MKRKKLTRYVWLPLLVMLAATGIYIYKEYHRTHQDTGKLRPDYSVRAAEFINEFIQNEQTANKKYWDKVVRVEGVVKDLSRDDNGFYSIILGDSTSSSSIRCSLDSLHNEEMNFIQKGKTATLKGICAGFNADELLGSDVILVRTVVDKRK